MAVYLSPRVTGAVREACAAAIYRDVREIGEEATAKKIGETADSVRRWHKKRTCPAYPTCANKLCAIYGLDPESGKPVRR